VGGVTSNRIAVSAHGFPSTPDAGDAGSAGVGGVIVGWDVEPHAAEIIKAMLARMAEW
jgi:hypothetical protein